MTSYNFGDIVLIAFVHKDMQGVSKRPALVIFDDGDEDVVVARITTQEHQRTTDYKIIDWQSSGLLAESYIRLSKIATFQKALIIKSIGKLPSDEIDDIKKILIKMLAF